MLHTIDQTEIAIRKTVAATIEIIINGSPLRSTSAKSTFYVSPEQHRYLDLICRVTGKTRQQYYSLALEKFLNEKCFLDDIPVDDIKTKIV